VNQITKCSLGTYVLLYLLLCCGYNYAESDLNAKRIKLVHGDILDNQTEVTVDLKASSMRSTAKNIYKPTVINDSFSVYVKLFPGDNLITASTPTGSHETLAKLNIKKPSLRIQLSWAGNDQDYDLHVNHISDIFYGNASADGGVLDHDWTDNEDDGNPIENISYSSAAAGLYRIYVNYYTDNADPEGSPQLTTVKIYVNEELVHSDSYTITQPDGDLGGDGESIWNVGTIVLHAADQVGGYAADSSKRLDMTDQGALKGFSPRTTYSVTELTGPNDADPVYLTIGESVQFTASGIVNYGSGNDQSGEIIEKFTNSDPSVGVIGPLGVFTASAIGHTQISASNYSGSPIDVYVLTVDLDVWNGGSDLDNGEVAGSQGSQVPEDDEESIGSYLLVNWDDDDGDGAINATGSGWISLPKPDLEESTAITDEDNLAQLKPNLEPILDTGTVELEVSGADANKIKLWEKKIKETEVTLTSNKKAWDLSNSTQKSEFEDFIANSFWIEGVDEGSTERAVTFTLRYKDSDETEICNDVNKATIVMLNLGNVVGREVNSDALAERGHTSIVGRYNGVCMKDSLVNASQYTLYESDGSDNWGGTEPGSQEALLTHITTCPDRDYFGSLTPFLTSYYNSSSMPNTVAGYTIRLKILLVARRLIDNTASIGYTKFNTVLPGSWNGDLSTVTDLRCDGFVEVCYEWCDVNSWGRIVGGSAQYSLLTAANQDDHNKWAWGDDPEDGDSDFWAWLMPVTQIGYADTYIGSHYPPYSGGVFNYTSNNFEGTFWESAFSEQQLVKPTL